MMKIHVNRGYNTYYNHKRIRRIMRALGLFSVIRRIRHSCTIRSPKEQTAENILNREFTVKEANQKWLTDVTDATPLFHSDRGFQYTSVLYH